MTTEWEYKIYDLHLGVNPDSVEELDYLGSDRGGNWELVTIGTVPYRIGPHLYEGKRFYFKRPKPVGTRIDSAEVPHEDSKT